MCATAALRGRARVSDALCAILTHNNYTVDAVYDGEDAYAYGLSDNYDGIFSRSAMSSQLSKYRL